MSLRDTAKELQHILAELQHLDLWPPLDAVRTVIHAIEQAIQIASSPPPPEPADLADTAAAWHRAGQAWDEAILDLGCTRRASDEQVWEGSAGDAYRASLTNTGTRFGSVTDAIGGVRSAIFGCESSMATARLRWRRGVAELRELLRPLDPSWDPRDLVEELKERVLGAARAIGELEGAYLDAAVAVEDCTAAVERALDGVQLPHHLVDGLPAISQTNLPSSSGNARQDTGPLRGSAAERAQAALDAMSPAERAAVEKLLAEAGSDSQRAWILAAVASGLTGAALADYASRLRTMSEKQLAALDPTTSSGTYGQPDTTTCGSSSLVMSRMLNDPAYAMWITTGHDPTGQLPDTPDSSGPPEVNESTRFGAEAVAMHHRTNTTWPEPLGTFPTDVDKQMSTPGGSGVPGTSYSTTIVDPASPNQTYDAILDAVSRGHTVPMYVYGVDEPGSGAHVTLVVGASGDNVTVYEPGYGTYKTMTRDEFNSGNVSGATTWSTPLSVSLPD